MAEIDKFLRDLIALKGSDLHLKQGNRPRFRIHGELSELEKYPVLAQDYLIKILPEICGDDAWRRFESTGDADFAYEFGSGDRFRCNYFRHFYGYGAIFRLIPSKILSFKELALPKIISSFANLNSGLVLITGPTGSGKSTTLAAIIDMINANFVKKIITIEEPIEFLHANKESLIVHREVEVDTPSFSRGLRSALKTDADIILVGEMRDRETIELALTAAEMGILVFSTLHTNSATKTIDRIINSFPTAKKNQIRDILANTLRVVVSQQLLRSRDGSRMWGAFEVLLRTTALPAIIRGGDTKLLNTEIQTNREMGMISMDMSLLELMRTGRISKESAYLKALDKTLFR